MDKNLSWKYHIEHVLNKISKTVDMISKLRHFVLKHALLNIYKSLIVHTYRTALLFGARQVNQIEMTF